MNKNKKKRSSKKYKDMSDEQKRRIRDRQKNYRKNMSDEQKQKLKDYLREYYKTYYIEKKFNDTVIQHDNDDNKIIKIFNDNLKL